MRLSKIVVRLGLAALLVALLTVLLRLLSRRRVGRLAEAAGFRVLGDEGPWWAFTMNVERPQ